MENNENIHHPVERTKWWRYAKYCHKEDCREGFTTLDLVYSSDKLKPDKAIILTLDTISYDWISEKTYNDYTSFIHDVENYIRQYICINNASTEIKVLPGIMGAGPRAEFRGNLDDSKLLTLYRLYMGILKYVEEKQAMKKKIVITWRSYWIQHTE